MNSFLFYESKKNSYKIKKKNAPIICNDKKNVVRNKMQAYNLRRSDNEISNTNWLCGQYHDWDQGNWKEEK